MLDRTAEAYALCKRLARSHYENFPVASRLLPRRMRPHIAALYGFARTADDFADEGDQPADERLRLLDDWLVRLRRSSARPSVDASPTAPLGQDDAVFVALGDTIRRLSLPVTLFEDLLSAFRQDVTTRRYGTWEDVLDYCRRSANPVGRLVLRIAGYNEPALDRASDALCTALQLTNFWQDLERDWFRGRLYVPEEEVTAAGARERDLDARHMTPGWRLALSRAAERTRSYFREGRPVCDAVHGRLRFELRLTWLGGERILNRLERTDFDVFSARPALGAADAAPLIWRAATWR